MAKPLPVWITINCGKFWKKWEYQTTWPASWETCMQVRKQQLELDMGRWSWDGGGIGRGDHFLPHKFIKRTFKHWVNSTKQLLNAGRRHQAPRKAAHCLQKEVGKNIKDKKRDKRGRDGAPSREGSLKKREVSKHQETFSVPNLCWALEAQRAT